MTDVLKFSKKAFTWVVVALTIAWSMGLAAFAPLAAQAATCPELEAGDEIRFEGSGSVFILNDMLQRVAYPHATIRQTWKGTSFADVHVLPTSCGEVYPPATQLPLSINPAPGTILVKTTSLPDVFAILPGNCRAHIGSEEVARALYGNNWGTKVIDMNDVWFASLNCTADPINEAVPHEGMVIATEAGGTQYYVWDGMLHEVDGTVSYAQTVSSEVFNSFDIEEGSTVTPAEVRENPVQSDATTTPGGEEQKAGQLNVSLAAETAVAADIIAEGTASEYSQGNISFTSVNFRAGADADVKVTSVKFTREGISADTDLGSLYLYDGDKKIAEYTSFNDKVLTFTSNTGLFTVAKGSAKVITLRGDLARGTVAGGKKIAFSIMSADHVVASSQSVAGSFPVRGNSMSTTQVTDLGHVYLSNYTTYPSSVKADEANKELWRFTLNADAQDMEVRRLNMTMVGTISASEIQNLRLEVGGVVIGSAVNIADDKTVTFDLSASPIKINAGQNKVVVVRGDMLGGSGRVFKFTFQRVSDVWAYDTEYGVFVPVAKDATTTAFGVIQPTSGNGTSVDSGTLTVGVASSSPNGNIADSATGITLAEFSFEAAGENVKIDNLEVYCSSGDSTTVLTNVKVLLNGTQVGTTDTTQTCDNDSSAGNSFSFGNTFVVRSGVANKASVTVVADLTAASVAANDTITVKLDAGSSNATGQTTLGAISTTAQSARTLTVKSGTAVVTENNAFADRSSSNPSGTLNATDVKIASFIITAGSGEAIDLTKITLADDSTSQLGDNFQNLKVKNGATQIGTTISSLNTTAGTYDFTPASAIRIAAGQQYVVDVYADIKSSVGDSATVLSPVAKVDSITATGVGTNADASYTTDVNLQNAYISTVGALTVTIDGDTPATTHLVMGQTGYSLARYKFAASSSEDVMVTDLVVSVSSTVGAAATGTLKNFTLWDGATQVGQASNYAGSGTSSNDGTSLGVYNNITFSGLNWTIPRNGTKYLTVKADVSTNTDGADSDARFSAHLLFANALNGAGSTAGAVTSRGLSSGTAITSVPGAIVSGANAMAVYRTKITVAFAPDSPSGAAVGGDDAIVAKINITNAANESNQDVTVKALNFAISHTTLSNTADRQLKVYKDSISAGNLLLTTQWLAGDDGLAGENFGNTRITDAGFTDATISANTTKLFIITMDTQDASTNDRLSISMDATEDIIWSDGDTSAINTVPDSLPLSPKTLTY